MKSMLKKIVAAAMGVAFGVSTLGVAVAAEAPVMPDLSKAKDGVYRAISSEHATRGVGLLSVTIKDGKIVSAAFAGIAPDGTPKEYSWYGIVEGLHGVTIPGGVTPEITSRAHFALKSNGDYAQKLVETQDYTKIDLIAGASISYAQFMETAKEIFDRAVAK